MNTWWLIPAIAVLALLAWPDQARADVTGDVTVQLGMLPLATQTEAVQYNLDFEVLSNIRWTVSGLTFGNRMALGVTGIEHAILSVETQLGAFDILSQAVFATPFSNGIPDDIDTDGIPNSTDPDIDGDGVANLADPAPFGSFDAFIKPDIDGDGEPNAVDPDIDGDGDLNGVDATPFGTNFVVTPLTRPIGPTVFVKKRLTTTINLAGFTITNLAIFEDVNFTHPFPSSVQTYGAEMQQFRFGNIITILGQTLSGINIRSVTGLGADPAVPNLIKKASFQGSVCEESADLPGDYSNFAFCVEQLFIDNITVGSLSISSATEFRILPLVLSQTLTLQHGFFNDAVNVTASFTMDDVTSFSPLSTSLFINSAPLTVSLVFNGALAVTSATATLSVGIDGTLFATTGVFLPSTGLNSLSFSFQTVSLSGLSVFSNVVLSNPGAGPGGGFGSYSVAFTVSGNIVPHFGVNGSMGFTNLGLSTVNAQFVFKF